MEQPTFHMTVILPKNSKNPTQFSPTLKEKRKDSKNIPYPGKDQSHRIAECQATSLRGRPKNSLQMMPTVITVYKIGKQEGKRKREAYNN